MLLRQHTSTTTHRHRTSFFQNNSNSSFQCQEERNNRPTIPFFFSIDFFTPKMYDQHLHLALDLPTSVWGHVPRGHVKFVHDSLQHVRLKRNERLSQYLPPPYTSVFSN